MGCINKLVITTLLFTFIFSAYSEAEDSKCRLSSPEVKGALDNARKNAEQASDVYVRAGLLHEIAKDYAKNGDFDSALRVIRTDSSLMWQASDLLARNMLRCGHDADVKAAAVTLDGRSRSLMLQWLAEWQTRHNQPDAAASSVELIRDPDIRREAQLNVAIIKSENVPDTTLRTRLAALSVSEQSIAQTVMMVHAMKCDADAVISDALKLDDKERIYALYSAIETAIHTEKKECAASLSKMAAPFAQKFASNAEQAYPLSLLATAQARAGAFEYAVELAKNIPDTQRRDEALVMIAVEMIKAKDVRKLDATVQLLSNPTTEAQRGEREMAWFRIAIAQANSGYTEQAITTLANLRDTRLQSLALWERSYAHAKAGRFREAQTLATQIHSENPRDIRGEAIRIVAAVIANQKHASDAETWARSLPQLEDRVKAFLGIADGLLADVIQEIPPYFQD